MLSLIAAREASTISPSFCSPRSKLPRMCLQDMMSMVLFVLRSYWQIKPSVTTDALRIL